MLCFVKIKKYLKDKSNSYVLWLFFRVPCRPCWALSRRLYYQSQQSERVTIPVSKCSQASQVSQMSRFLETKTYKVYFPPVGLIESFIYMSLLCVVGVLVQPWQLTFSVPRLMRSWTPHHGSRCSLPTPP